MSESNKKEQKMKGKERKEERGRERDGTVHRGDTIKEERKDKKATREYEEVDLFITRLNRGAQLLSNCLSQQVQ